MTSIVDFLTTSFPCALLSIALPTLFVAQCCRDSKHKSKKPSAFPRKRSSVSQAITDSNNASELNKADETKKDTAEDKKEDKDKTDGGDATKNPEKVKSKHEKASKGKHANSKASNGKKTPAKGGKVPDKADIKKKGPNDNNEQKTNKEDSPPVIDEEKVQKLGNLDMEIKEKQDKFATDIDKMPSDHEFDKKPPSQAPQSAHVVINDKKCKLYETNNEETKEDDLADI
ncbi:hypothetical protein M3Y97_00129200 [Aphelenchoides bicaudatus]|nr:hypothetical protein M3Y97_00129200 [Aphelenchoides bicaudatus]